LEKEGGRKGARGGKRLEYSIQIALRREGNGEKK